MMHHTVKNLIKITDKINIRLKQINKIQNYKIIAVSKTFPIEQILPLIDYGQKDFGENKVQEAIEKWSGVKNNHESIKLHLIGKLQTNKVKIAVKIFEYIHSVDSFKLAKKISEEQIKQKKDIKIFIQVNVGNEPQKSGIDLKELKNLYSYCKEINLKVVGLMCIPPINQKPLEYFKQMNVLQNELKLFELSMGMSADYLEAVEQNSSYLRIGSNIFGKRS
jgi:PLP dependent protein